MVAQLVLVQLVWVRIPTGLPFLSSKALFEVLFLYKKCMPKCMPKKTGVTEKSGTPEKRGETFYLNRPIT